MILPGEQIRTFAAARGTARYIASRDIRLLPKRLVASHSDADHPSKSYI